jgi:hypothetical protein
MPREIRECIKQLRAEGKPWRHISEVLGIPSTSLNRWYAVRIEQPAREIEVLARAQVLLEGEAVASRKKTKSAG